MPQALLKGSIDTPLLSLFLALQTLLDKREHTLFDTHMGSYTGLPGPMSEGNAQAYALVSIVDIFQKAVASHQFFIKIVMHFARSSNSHVLRPNKLLKIARP